MTPSTVIPAGLSRESAQQAQSAIRRDLQVCYDVAAERGQTYGNVAHTAWFLSAVAETLDRRRRRGPKRPGGS